MNGDRPGKLPKPPLKASKGNIQLGVADFFKPSIRTASVKGADEQRAGVAHAKWVAEAGEGSTGRAGCSSSSSKEEVPW
jgi:hypothetical protein